VTVVTETATATSSAEVSYDRADGPDPSLPKDGIEPSNVSPAEQPGSSRGTSAPRTTGIRLPRQPARLLRLSGATRCRWRVRLSRSTCGPSAARFWIGYPNATSYPLTTAIYGGGLCRLVLSKRSAREWMSCHRCLFADLAKTLLGPNSTVRRSGSRNSLMISLLRSYGLFIAPGIA
jgi:hypothetical protein